MARAFLVVMDSVGIGGAPDADRYFNGDVPDTGANTLGHIAQACSAGKAEDGRSGQLHVPNLASLASNLPDPPPPSPNKASWNMPPPAPLTVPKRSTPTQTLGCRHPCKITRETI